MGHLGREGLDEAAVRRFRERREPVGECASCFRYPACIRLKMCEESRECFPEMRAQWLGATREGMLAVYDSAGAPEADGGLCALPRAVLDDVQEREEATR